jgi:predicted outer membrane lipoprotein
MTLMPRVPLLPLCLACTFGVVAALPLAYVQPDDIGAGRIPRLLLPMPLDVCSSAPVITEVALVLRIPLGFEQAAVPCARPSPDTEELIDVTVTDVLNRIVAAVPIYVWEFTDGVLVVRPRPLVQHKEHFLLEKVSAYDATAEDLGPALKAISVPFRPRGFVRRDGWLVNAGRAEPPMSVAFPGGTLLEALNALVRGRSDLSWRLTYCGPEATVANAELRLVSSERNMNSQRSDVLIPLTDDRGRPLTCR